MSVTWVPHVGSEFAGYRMESLIGTGGMSIVYRAEHLALGRTVALKLLDPRLSQDASFRERFERESRLAASLDHPNVVPIYEAGEKDGVLFIAMRYVQGSDLKTLVKREGPLPLRRAAGIVNQVAGALHQAHERGLVHRDVKPANILLSADVGVDGADHAYLSDFGVAKHTSSQVLTKTGMFVGTAEYAAPEQIEGKQLDGRADVYALGCVLYECLTGDPAYADKDSEVALMYAHLLEPPPTVTDKRPDLPAEIDEVIAKAMAKARDERYATPKELASGLRELLALAGAAPSATATGAPETVLAARPTEGAAPATAGGDGGPAAPGGGAAQALAQRLGGRALAGLIAVAALVVAGIVAAIYIATGGDDGTTAGEEAAPPAAETGAATGGGPSTTVAPAPPPAALLEVLVPTQIGQGCTTAATPREAAVETNTCVPREGSPVSYPNEFELSFFPDAQSLEQAYTAEMSGIQLGDCGGAVGERVWIHEATGKRGGRRICYVDGGGQFVIVWTHEKLDASDHVDMIGVAREPGRAPTIFRNWWTGINDHLGKCRPQVAEEVCFDTIQRIAGA